MIKQVMNDILKDLGINTNDDNGLTEEDIKLLIMAKQAKDIKAIRDVVVSFFMLTCISIVILAIWVF